MRKIPGNTLKILEPVLIRSTLISPMVKYVVGLRAVRPTRTQVVQLHELIEGKLLNNNNKKSHLIFL